MRRVPLSGSKGAGHYALVDDDDYECVSSGKWYALEVGAKTRITYAYGRIAGCRTLVLMHKFLTGYAEVGHGDGNGLNNQRYNLEDVTHAQNQQKQRPNSGSSSRFRGVGWDKSREKWMAKIQVDGKTVNLGRFAKEEDAALAYNEAAFKAWGKHAYLNTVD